MHVAPWAQRIHNPARDTARVALPRRACARLGSWRRNYVKSMPSRPRNPMSRAGMLLKNVPMALKNQFMASIP